MISFRTMASSREASSPTFVGAQPLLSAVITCRCPEDIGRTLRALRALSARGDEVETLVVAEPPERETHESELALASLARSSQRFMRAPVRAGLPAVRLNEGIMATRGRWLWLLDAAALPPEPDWAAILERLGRPAADRLLVLIHPHEETLPAVPGVPLPWLDLLFKGWVFPFGNVIVPRAVFERHGLLEPHIAMSAFYGQEFLSRVCRFFAFEKVVDPGAMRGVERRDFPGFFHQWLDVDRSPALQASRIGDYDVDDLRRLKGDIPDSDLWQAYLEHVLPYYYLFRHRLAEGFPDRPQSSPASLRRFRSVKGYDYETLVDVGFRNFDHFAQGRRFLKTSFVHLQQMKPPVTDGSSGLLLIRTADPESRDLARQETQGGQPVGYALDDDMLHFYTYGESYSAFRPGETHYDAMVETIRAADVVLCSSAHIENAVHEHNPRTIHYEGSVLPAFLPEAPRARRCPIRIGYAGGGYRTREMEMLGPALERIAGEYGDRVVFEFWGLEPKDLPGALARASFVPFSVSYYEYLGRLHAAGFDAMLVPLCWDATPRRGKAPNKLYETAVAGAVGIYSDVPTYAPVARHGLGLMVKESADAWYDALRWIVEMPDAEYIQIKGRSLDFVREFYSTPAMLPVHEAAHEAILFHGATRASRGADGRPRVMYAFPAIGGRGGGEFLYRRRIELALTAGIQPLAVVPEVARDTPDWGPFQAYLAERGIECVTANYRIALTTPPVEGVLPHAEEETSVRELLEREPVALVHSGGYAPAFGKACSDLGIPHVVSSYGLDESYEWPIGRLPYRHCDLVQSDSMRYARKWAALFDSEWYCARDVAPEGLFARGFERLFGSGEPREGRLRLGSIGTPMVRKRQLETIEAVAELVKEGHDVELWICGSGATDPPYYQLCKTRTLELGLVGRVSFRSHQEDIESLYDELDVLLSVSTFESFPNTIKEATAAGVLVVASTVGGITELMKDGVNAILTAGVDGGQILAAVRRAIALTEADSLALRRNAYRLARQAFHPRRALADLMQMYTLALERAAARTHTAPRASAPGLAPDGVVRVESPSGRPASHFPVDHGVRCRLVPRRRAWVGVDVLLGTHGAAASGTLRAEVLSVAGHPVREAAVELSAAKDNDWVRLRFPPIENSAKQPFTLSLRLEGAGGPLSLYASDRPVPRVRRLLRRSGALPFLPTLHCRMLYGP
jgi:glycosyltransferase involved in cell wall biosynthesis